MVGRRTAQDLLAAAVLGCGYFGLAKAGNAVSFAGGVQAIWLPVGWAVGFLYVFGLRLWPGALAADVLLGVSAHEPAVTQIMQTAGNMAEVLVAAALARRLLGPDTRLDSVADLGRFLVATGLGTTISAPVGTLSTIVGGELGWSEAPVVWRTWWLGDTCGAVLVAGLLLVWRHVRSSGYRAARLREAAAVGAIVLGLSYVGFRTDHPVTYIVFPGLIWAALRFGAAGATAAGLLAALTAVALTAHHRGPFVVSSIDDTVFGVQLYVLVAAITCLALGVAVDARRVTLAELEASRVREAEQAERERQRIARDLHDSVSQSLVSLTLHASAAARLVESGADGSERAAGPILEMRELAYGALAELRALVLGLRPDSLAARGLMPALTTQAAALSAQRSVLITVTGTDAATLDPPTELHLYRLVQEAMANAATHARARTISVTCLVRGAVLELSVTDDGIGFDPRRIHPGHLGLQTMRSRAADIGAELDIASDAGGTTVTVRVPLPQVRAPRRPPMHRAQLGRRTRSRVPQ